MRLRPERLAEVIAVLDEARTLYALFRDGQQISKAHTTRAAVVMEAFERGLVGHYHPDFPGDPPTYTALLYGYEIRPVTTSS